MGEPIDVETTIVSWKWSGPNQTGTTSAPTDNGPCELRI